MFVSHVFFKRGVVNVCITVDTVCFCRVEVQHCTGMKVLKLGIGLFMKGGDVEFNGGIQS